MNEAVRPRWYVEDGIAHQRLTAVDGDAEGVRLDRPGWRPLARAGTPPAGLVLGAGVRAADLAAALADLGRRGPVALALPARGVPPADWVASCADWHLDGHPEPRGDLLVLHLRRDADGPTLATVAALHHREAPAPTRQPAPWRLHLLDATAQRWFGDLATSTNRATVAVGAAGTPDPPPVGDGTPPPTRLTVVTVDDAADRRLDDAAVTDDPRAGDDGVRVLARPLDLRRLSPVGCDPRGATGAPVLALHADAHASELPAVREAAAEVGAAVREAGTRDSAEVAEVVVPGDGTPSGRELADLRGAIALLDHPAVHADPAAHARWLLASVAAGVPVLLLAPLPGPVAALVGSSVAAALAATTVDDVLTPDLRERTSVLQRRGVLAAHTSAARMRQLADDLGLLAPAPRTVSVVLATNRETFLEHACRQVARQDWPRLELVLVAHADAVPERARHVVDELLGEVPTTVLHVASRHSLGDALNVGVEHAGGELVTKFDDDDWYSPGHVTDVVTALDYSGADVAGKAAEFLHLSGADTTLRRWGRGGERYSPTIAGATLTFRREVWRDIAGFPRVSLAEDRGFVEDVVAAGGTSYRSHPFGFLVNRHGAHAWEVTDQEFLDVAVATRPGLDHDWTLT